MKEADERGVPLYVNNGFPTALKIDFPGVFALLEVLAFSNRLPTSRALMSCSIGLSTDTFPRGLSERTLNVTS